jgi:hypothetical protein
MKTVKQIERMTGRHQVDYFERLFIETRKSGLSEDTFRADCSAKYSSLSNLAEIVKLAIFRTAQVSD